MLHLFADKMVRQKVFTTALFYSSYSYSAKDKRDVHWKSELTHIDSHSRHECDHTNSDEVITADTARVGDWRLRSNKTEESTACSSERPEVRTC